MLLPRTLVVALLTGVLLAALACRAEARLPALKTGARGHYLVTADGRPFFWLGDTAWYLFYNVGLEDRDLYLRDRAAKGFNVLQVITLSPRGQPNAFGEQPLIDNDPLKPNERFWRYADEVVRRASEMGFYVALVTGWRHLVFDKPVLRVDNARAWGRWLGRRYRDADVVWVLGGDQPAGGREKLWREMAEGLREGDGGRHLMTYHPMGHQTSSTWFHRDGWLDFNMLQTGHARDWPCYDMVAHDWVLKPPKPVVDGEPPYEHIGNNLRPGSGRSGDVISAWDCRKALYWDVFAGAAGVTYGCAEVYHFWEPGRPQRRWGETMPWKQALNLPAAGQVQYLRRLMLSRPYFTRIPDQALITAGQARGAGHGQATRDAGGSYAMVYIPDGHKVRVDLGKLAGDRLVAWWFNPRDGKVYGRDGAVTDRPFARLRRHERDRGFEPLSQGPGEDWVLVLDDEARGYPPPGAQALPFPR